MLISWAQYVSIDLLFPLLKLSLINTLQTDCFSRFLKLLSKTAV